MNKKERTRTEQAQKILFEVRNFLTEERNEQTDEQKRKAYDENITKVLKCIFDLLTPTK